MIPKLQTVLRLTPSLYHTKSELSIRLIDRVVAVFVFAKALDIHVHLNITFW